MSAEMIRQIHQALGPVTAQPNGTIVAQACFPADFCGFAGHFPDAPILPALVQLLTAQEVIRKIYGNVSINEVFGAKYKRPVKPLELLEICCYPQPLDKACKISLRVGASEVSSFNFRFETE